MGVEPVSPRDLDSAEIRLGFGCFAGMTTRDLFEAINNYDLLNIKVLLDPVRSPLVDVNGRQGLTPLHLAGIVRGDAAMVSLLLKHPCVDVNAQSGFGNTALSLACGKGYVASVVMLLADPRVDTGWSNPDHETPLWIAVRWGHVDVVRRLVASGRPLRESLKANCPYDCRIGTSLVPVTALELARRKGELAIWALLESLARDPTLTRHGLQIEFGDPLALSIHLFCLLVLLCDDYLSLGEGSAGMEATIRCFSILTGMPMELQMVICRRVFGKGGDMFMSELLEPALRHIVLLY